MRKNCPIIVHTKKRGRLIMKHKRMAIAAVALSVAAVLTAGCGQTAQKANYILATGGTSGTYYPFGGAMCQIFNEKVDNVNFTAQSTGASVENCKLIESGEAEFALIQNDMIDYAYNGTEVFAEDGEKLQNLRVIASLYPEVIQLVVSESSGIKNVTDLKGKKISVGAAGSGTEANARHITEAAGLSYDDMTISYLSFAESADNIKDGHIDGAFVTAGIPNAAIQDVAAQNKIRIVTMDSGISAKVIASHPFYSYFNVPTNTYNNQTDAADTVAVLATLVVSKDVPEDTVYKITKALFENQSELAVAHAKGGELSLDTALNGISIPLHPGSEKYYKEAGVLK